MSITKYSLLRERFGDALAIMRSEIRDLNRSEVARLLQLRGHEIKSREIGFFEGTGRRPTAEVTVELLRIFDASFGDLERLMVDPSIRELRGPTPVASAARLLGPSLKSMRRAEGLSPSGLVKQIRGTRLAMGVEKLERWESGELIPSILMFIWAVWKLGRKLGDLDGMLSDSSSERPEGARV